MNVIKGCRHGLMIYNKRDEWQGKSFDVYGEYSEEEVRLYAKVVNQGDVAIEIGANIGSLAVPLSKLVGLLLTFEPERTAFNALAGNIAINNLRNVYCFQQGMGENVGTLNVPELDWEKTTNFGALELDKDYTEHPQYKGYPVAMNTIDNLHLPQCELIKVDVEGMELAVLKGATNTIDRLSPTLIVEDDRPDKSEALREFIQSKGYKMYLHFPPFFNPNNWHGVKEDVFGNVVSSNLFCHKKDITFDPITEFGMQPI